MARAIAFYREVLGLRRAVQRGRDRGVERDVLVLEPRGRRRAVPAEHGGVALRVADVEAAVEEFRAGGGEVIGIEDTGVCHMGFVKDPDGNVSSSTAVTRRRKAWPGLTSSSTTARCRCRPRPTSRGASPTSGASIRTPSRERPMLGVRLPVRDDVGHRRGRVGHGRPGLEIERRPRAFGSSSSTIGAAARRARRLRREVRSAERGPLEARVAGPRPEGRRPRAAALRPDREPARRWRALLAPACGCRARQPVQPHRGPLVVRPGLAGYSNAVVELFVGQGAKVEYVSLQNLARETWHFASHRARVERDAELDWVAGGFGSRRARCGSRTT